MLCSVETLRGFSLRASDGDIGHVDGFLFDDEKWTVRYLIAATGGWLTGRQVLISPIALGETDRAERRLHVRLTRNQVETSPPIDSDPPVSRQREIEYHRYYGWPYYWGGPGLWGPEAYPGALYAPVGGMGIAEVEAPAEGETNPATSHVRSTAEVMGYSIRARDDEIGYVADFLLEDATWAIRYLAVDTGNWWPGKMVLVPTHWLQEVDWVSRTVGVDLDRETIRHAPDWDPNETLTRDYEERLHGYYGRTGYWPIHGSDQEAIHERSVPGRPDLAGRR